jgi:Ras-related protein Rab-5C
MTNQNIEKYTFKLVLVGSSAVGKSSLVLRFTRDKFNEYQASTVGASFITKDILVDPNTLIKFEIWDTAGQERYDSLVSIYYRSAAAVMVVYDMTDAYSFARAKMWIKELRMQWDIDVIMLVCNKIDLVNKREVSMEDAARFASDYGALFMETSAKNNYNVTEAFKLIAEKLPKIGRVKKPNIILEEKVGYRLCCF